MRPPYSIEAEQSLLGALIVNNDAFDHVGSWFEPQHFFEDLHGRIYAAIGRLIEQGHKATPITLAPYFAAENVAPDVTVAQYFGRLAAAATTIINVPDYARTIFDAAQRRGLMALAGDVARRASSAHIDDPVDAMIEDAETALYEIGEKGGRLTHVEPFDMALREALEQLDAAMRRGDSLSGLSTGLKPMDYRLGGLAPSDLIVIAGRPSMGKTTLALNMAVNAARAGAPVAFFSLEMSNSQIAGKVMATKTGITTERMRRGDLSEDELRHFVHAAKGEAGLPLYLDETGGLGIAQLSMRARRMKRKYGIEAIFVDYLQLIQGDGRDRNRVLEMTRITMGLKALAKELKVPVIALSQLSRGVETRENKRPLLSDLRESGSIEQDADIVLFVYREDYYLERAKPDPSSDDYAVWLDRLDRARGRAEVICAKHRHGAIGTVDLRFDAERSQFHGGQQK